MYIIQTLKLLAWKSLLPLTRKELGNSERTGFSPNDIREEKQMRSSSRCFKRNLLSEPARLETFLIFLARLVQAAALQPKQWIVNSLFENALPIPVAFMQKLCAHGITALSKPELRLAKLTNRFLSVSLFSFGHLADAVPRAQWDGPDMSYVIQEATPPDRMHRRQPLCVYI